MLCQGAEVASDAVLKEELVAAVNVREVRELHLVPDLQQGGRERDRQSGVGTGHRTWADLSQRLGLGPA